MKILLVKPALAGNQTRGAGFYHQRLFEALRDFREVEMYEAAFSDLEKIGAGVDLVHFTYFDPFFLTLPFKNKKPTVVTVHDLIPLVFPKRFPRGMKGEIKWQIQKKLLDRADAIITDSESSKKDIVRLAGIDETKIKVIYLAADKIFKPMTNTAALEDATAKYCLPKCFILYVGDVNWNKNVKNLVTAFAKLKTENLKLKTTAKNLKLVLVGKVFKDEKLKEIREIEGLIKKFGMEKEVLKLGFAPTKDLALIYNLAAVYVQPSFYEGFGLPVLEAMASGCPVVCAKTGSLPEAAGKAGIYANTGAESLAGGILKVLKMGEKDHQKLIQKSIAQAGDFKWEQTAEATLKVYQEVLA